MTLPGSVAPETSEAGASRRPSFRAGPLLRRAGWGVLAGGVVTALVFSVLSLAKLHRFEGQLSGLAQQQRGLQQDERIAGMQSALDTLRRQRADDDKQLADLRQKVNAAVQKAGSLSPVDMDAITQQAALLKQLSTGQESLKTRLSTLETQSTSRPVTTTSAGTAKTVSAGKAPASTGKKTAASRTRTTSTHKSSKPVAVRAKSVPFVLTGTERRGAQSLAAVAPKGYRSLSQIALISEGEAVAGWTLVHAGYGQATFRVNGRTVLVNAQ